MYSNYCTYKMILEKSTTLVIKFYNTCGESKDVLVVFPQEEYNFLYCIKLPLTLRFFTGAWSFK